MTTFRQVLLVMMLGSTAATAAEFQDLNAINQRASSATNGAARPVDQRLKLAACPEALLADPPALGTVTIRCASLGWRVRVLTDNQNAAADNTPVIIKRGDPVSVHFVAPGFSVTTNGIAEGEARIGERVRVRVEQKLNPVVGEAIDVGSVRIGSLN